MPSQWTCDECGSTFQRREHHQRHIRTHTKERPFACSVCGHSFGRIDSLARHHSSTHVDSAQMASLEPGERQRVSRACKRCSTAKVRCDGKRPCEKCTVASTECVYEPPKRRRAAQALPHAAEPAAKRRPSELECPPENIIMPSMDPLIIQEETPFLDPIDPQICAMPTVANDTTPDFMHADFFGGPRNFNLHNDMSLDWMVDGLDMSFWPSHFDLQQETEFLQDIRRTEIAPPQPYKEPIRHPVSQLPPTPASDIADLFSRSHSPVLDKDAVDVRLYRPTRIEVDAPLTIPDLDSLSIGQADMEDYAHVDALPSDKLDAVALLIEDVQTKPHYPLFNNPKLPPQSVINAWIQSYFEYFHPIFPVLHKATFSSPDTPALLVLAVAAIGAQFSNLKNALECASSLQELVRRASSRQCEFQNKHGRTVWMTQVVMLNSLTMSHCGERRALEVAEILQAVPVALARRKGLLDDVLTHERISQLQVPLEQTWRLWAVDEERRRTGFGVWLVDSAFRSNFNLTTVLNRSELRNSLPQSEQRWIANNAQSWASYPPGLGSGRTKSLAEIISAESWLTVWSRTGTIGKQVILQQLMDDVRPRESFDHQEHPPSANSARAKEILVGLLTILEEEQETPVNDLKALIANKVICLAALMLCSSPVVDLTTIALNAIYDRVHDRELAIIAQSWKNSANEGRRVVLHAARLFETIRNHHTTHYSMPAYLLKAVLTLWLYSFLFERPKVTGFFYQEEEGNPTSIALGMAEIKSAQVQDWLSYGRGRVKLPGMANLLCAQGRQKLLKEATVAMGSLKSWGISKGYLQLLKRLEASGTTSTPS
ncbi:fungal-specific transcription factor domain-containing protein [Dendryphion nanum]|uniref:Fungal-specific transcription factor domain-containing protein n=1 Tax=Dendryphion nanum TaxID=256645 RepID=A0A9P9IVB2_9PLEO|nr:fungal-specific transcription factor domain-containing protein [Dendryphion nanum]